MDHSRIPLKSSKHFLTIDEELEHYQNEANHYYNEYIEAISESKEFEVSSRALEQELELQISQQERTIADLRQRNGTLNSNNEKLKERHLFLSKDLEQLQKRHDDLIQTNERLNLYIRQLEQKNDDLERANRIVTETVSSYESMLDQAYEKNAILENEIDEKEALKIKLQRLMDTMKDLQNEINVKNMASNSINKGVKSNSEHFDTYLDNSESRKNIPLISAMNGVVESLESIHRNVAQEKSEISTQRIKLIIEPSLECTNLIDGSVLLSTSQSSVLTSSQPNIYIETKANTTDINNIDVRDNIDQQAANITEVPVQPPKTTAINLSATTTALNIVRDMLRRVDFMDKFMCSECDRLRCVCPPSKQCHKSNTYSELNVNFSQNANDANCASEVTQSAKYNREEDEAIITSIPASKSMDNIKQLSSVQNTLSTLLRRLGNKFRGHSDSITVNQTMSS